MNRRKSSLQNTIISLLSEVMVTVVGFLLPKAIMVNYGSATNGLITSLQQFIQYFTLLEAGLSGAAIFALYKPLSESDTEKIEKILYSAKKMYGKIGGVFVLLVGVCSLVYPYSIAETGYSYWVISVLFCLIGLNGATQFLFIGKYKVLLNASQNSRYVALINSLSTCIYSINIIMAAHYKLNIVLAVGLGVMAYLLRAGAFYLVARHLFPQYNFHKCKDLYPFANQKEVFVQQMLSLLILNSSTLILTFTKTDMAEISVFTTFNMVLTAVFMITNAVNTGVSASFGDLIARQDQNRLAEVYKEYEILYQIFWTVIFSCVFALYQPFMQLYTKGIDDAIYLRPTLCVLFSVLGAAWVIRNQQSVLIVAAGKFKEIQRRSIIEAVLTIVLSTAGMLWWGLEGLIVGRIIAAFYRMIDFVIFNSRCVVMTNVSFTVKQIGISAGAISLVYLLGRQIQKLFIVDTYVRWVLYAIIIGIISVIFAVGMLLTINKSYVKHILKKALSRNRRGR